MPEDSIMRHLNRRIDHTLLRPEAGERDIRKLCDEAVKYAFHSVCVNPSWVEVASETLRDSGVVVVSVAGFPLGASRTDIKVAEACAAVEDGADEIDMVAAIGLIRDGRYADVEAETRKICRNLPERVALKVILEVGLLTDDQIREAVGCCISGGAQFVKSGTGFFGACTVQQIRLLAKYAEGRIAVKASGGIRTLAQARHMLEAGASRLGCSASVAIMQELESSGSGPQ